MAAARPTVSVQLSGGSQKPVTLPQVFLAPLRSDLVRYIHTNMNKNKRQAMGLKDESGYDTAAISWGTGRAVARIPRVPGGGTHRSGQGAFGNMCRGGGMFNPTKTWRRWHRRVNTTQKRHALASAISATAVPALVMARGHKIDAVPEIPLVLPSSVEGTKKTKDAVALLKKVGCEAELQHVVDSKKVRRGVGKMRNRRYTMRKGPLVIYKEDAGISRAFRNIPGVELCSVERLNLLKLAPGGTFGRFCVWTEAAFKHLALIYGTYKGGSELKKGYTLPRSMMTNQDISRIINSNEIQSVLTPAKMSEKRIRQRKNPLKNKSVLGRLCPGFNGRKRERDACHALKATTPKMTKLVEQVKALREKRSSAKKAAVKGHRAAKKAYFRNLESAYAVKAEVAEEAADEE